MVTQAYIRTYGEWIRRTKKGNRKSFVKGQRFRKGGRGIQSWGLDYFVCCNWIPFEHPRKQSHENPSEPINCGTWHILLFSNRSLKSADFEKGNQSWFCLYRKPCTNMYIWQLLCILALNDLAYEKRSNFYSIIYPLKVYHTHLRKRQCRKAKWGGNNAKAVRTDWAGISYLNFHDL